MEFRLYKPPLHCPIHDSHSLNGFQLTQEHLSNPLFVPYKVNEVFQEKDRDHCFCHDCTSDYDLDAYFFSFSIVPFTVPECYVPLLFT